jgi:hypothetical protein
MYIAICISKYQYLYLSAAISIYICIYGKRKTEACFSWSANDKW